MRITNFIRAALTILVLAGVGAAGCSNDSPEKAPVITTGPSASSPKSKPKPAAPALAFEGVKADGTRGAAANNSFELTGYIRNTGKATGTFGVNCRASDNGIAIIGDTVCTVAVANLVPGIASSFSCIIAPAAGGSHKSVLWTYWGTVTPGTPSSEYTISYGLPPPKVNIVFENVTAPAVDAGKFHLKGTIKNIGEVTKDVLVQYSVIDALNPGAKETGTATPVTTTLAPGASTTFDAAIDEGVYTKVTWTYYLDYTGSPKTERTISSP